MRATLDGFAALLRESVELPAVSPEELAAAHSAAPRMAELVRELWSCGVPATLTHGDLHVGNVAYDGDRVRIFDWTDAAVGHPFLDATLLARPADEGTEDDVDEPALDRDVIDAYTARWRAHLPGADVDRAMELALPVNELYQALSYEGIYRHQEDAARWELGGVVERFVRRLPRLVDGVGQPAELQPRTRPAEDPAR
jgi:aminoglycoside phosphotransferase (APT) family kinase protein